jgi:DNA-binding beta-propeller fold protein YncE
VLRGFGRGAVLVVLMQVVGCSEVSSPQPLPRITRKKVSALDKERAFTTFESGQVRPLALSQDGAWLYAVNTPDNRLEIFALNGNAPPIHRASVPVGLEPVAVAVRSASEVWVVNHLSDSISVVDVTKAQHAWVKRTLHVGDEPRDIVFAGPNRGRAFITTAHRGQNGRDPQLTTPGVGRADVWVFDSGVVDDTLGGTPLSVLTLFTDTPRALAVSADGARVYAAGFHTGNQTTTINERIVTNNGGTPPPFVLTGGMATPQNGLIVKYKNGHWTDDQGRTFDPFVRFNLPDADVFAIDANATPPVQTSSFAGVGTVLFNMAVNPASGKVYVTNTEARNDVRFEGHNLVGGGSSVRGHIAESRITVLDGSTVTPRHLNKHLDFSQQGTAAERSRTLAFPMDLTVSSNGQTLYVTAFGSSKIGVFSTAELESDGFIPDSTRQVSISGGGPSGVVLHEASGRLFVHTRFDNGISVVDTGSLREIHHQTMPNPEPESVQKGRRFLYDATLTSSHGDSACASCHIFGDLDGLAWDLGDPDGSLLTNPGPFKIPLAALPPIFNPNFHPLKGPMTTQSLRGMANHGPMHWRGDRTGGNDAPSVQPSSGAFDEDAAFKKFNVAFPGLLGRDTALAPDELQAFADFILQTTYPPNPNRNLDNSLTAAQEAGRAFYFRSLPDGREFPSDTFRNCNGCHVLNPNGNAQAGVARPGFFGTDGSYSFENETQFMKVPHLRNLYQKVGMFGMAQTFGLPIDGPVPRLSFLPPPFNTDAYLGDQVRGFGFAHDGSVDTLFRFVGASVFVERPPENPFPNPGGIPPSAVGIAIRRQLESFLLVFDSNLAPVVGQQATLTATNGGAVMGRVELLLARARQGECEVVVRGRESGRELGFLYRPASGDFLSNRMNEGAWSKEQLLARLPHGPLTFTAAPGGSGHRLALDRDLDGVLDGDED